MKVKLGNIAVLLNGDRGKNYPSQADITESGEIPFVNAGHLTGRNISFVDMNYISREKYEQLSAGKFCKGDILYCLRGSLGKKALVKGDIKGAIASSLVIIRADESIVDKDYLMFALDSPAVREQLLKANNGSSQPNLSAASVREYEFDLPDITTQVAIVNKLIKVRNVIDKRKQEIQELDNLIKSRFVEMFGDPVTNEKNWARLTLGDICEIGSSKRVFEKDYVSNGIPFFRTKEIVELSKGNAISTELFITEEHFAELKKCYGAPKKDDLLVSAVGTIGTIWIVNGDFEFYFKDGNLIQIKASPNFNSVFMKYLLNELIANYKNEMSTGTAYSALTIAGLKNMLVYDVPLELQEQFAAFVTQVTKLKFFTTTHIEIQNKGVNSHGY